MAKKSSGGISISSIIFLVVMYNIIFDDGDKKEVEIVEQDTIVQTSPSPERPTIKDQLNEVGSQLKEVGKQLKEEVGVAVNDIKKEFEETDPKEEPPEKKEEVLVAEPEAKKETLKSIEKPPETNGMKKL